MIQNFMRKILAIVFGSVALLGGLVAYAYGQPMPALPGSGVMQPAPEPTSALGATGLAVGLTGAIAAVTTLINGYWKDRSDSRVHELRKVALMNGVRKNSEWACELTTWANAVSDRVPGAPRPPNPPQRSEATEEGSEWKL